MGRPFRCSHYFGVSSIMPLINLSKEELQKIEFYLIGDTDPLVVSILEKIQNLDELCNCQEDKK